MVINLLVHCWILGKSVSTAKANGQRWRLVHLPTTNLQYP
jgi:hypothetical protein